MDIRSPVFSDELTPATPATPAGAESRAECLHFLKTDFSGKRLAEAEFSECVFTACNFSNANLRNADFADAIFERCDFSGAALGKSCFRRVRFTECKGVGADFSESSFRGASAAPPPANLAAEFATLPSGSFFATAFPANSAPRSKAIFCGSIL